MVDITIKIVVKMVGISYLYFTANHFNHNFNCNMNYDLAILIKFTLSLKPVKHNTSNYKFVIAVNTTRYFKYSQVLLMMGENIARNMYSWLGIINEPI